MRQVKDAIQFVKDSKEELNKVTWPDRDEVTSFTVVTIITVLILSVFLWAVDTGLMTLLKTLMK